MVIKKQPNKIECIDKLFSATSTESTLLESLHYRGDCNDKKFGPRRKYVDLLSADDIKNEDEVSLLPTTLYRKNLHAIVGAPRTGKTQLMLSMASSISNENCHEWLGKSGLGHGVVVIFNDEDSLALLKRRLIAANANMSNIRFASCYKNYRGAKGEPFSMKEHGEALKQSLDFIPNLAAIFFDNITTALGGFGRTGKEMRKAFNFTKEIAVSKNCAVIYLTHFSKQYRGKQPLSNISGSTAIAEVPRIILTTKKIEGKKTSDGSQVYALVREKFSIDKGEGTGNYYSIEEVAISENSSATRICWGEAFDESIDEPQDLHCTKLEQDKKMDVAVKFVDDHLSISPMPSGDLLKLALDHGIRARTLERARVKIGVVTFKSSDGHWWVALSKPELNHDHGEQHCVPGEGTMLEEAHGSGSEASDFPANEFLDGAGDDTRPGRQDRQGRQATIYKSRVFKSI